MQRKHRNGVVGIGVAVGVGECGVVDRQGLNHLLSGQCRPIRQFLQILELAYTESVLCTQTEHRHGYTCTAETWHGASERAVVHAQTRTFLRQSPGVAVLTPLHVAYVAGSQIVDHIFVLKRIHAADLYVGFPYGEICIVHGQFLIHVPVAELLYTAYYSHALRGQYLRQIDGERNVAGLGFRLLRTFGRNRTLEQRLQESGGVECFFVIDSLPEVAHHNLLVGSSDGEFAVESRLVDVAAFLQTDSVLVHDCSCGGKLDGCSPEVLTLAVQHERVGFCPAGYLGTGLHDAQLLSVHRAVIDLKCQIHRYIDDRFMFG